MPETRSTTKKQIFLVRHGEGLDLAGGRGGVGNCPRKDCGEGGPLLAVEANPLGQALRRLLGRALRESGQSSSDRFITNRSAMEDSSYHLTKENGEAAEKTDHGKALEAGCGEDLLDLGDQVHAEHLLTDVVIALDHHRIQAPIGQVRVHRRLLHAPPPRLRHFQVPTRAEAEQPRLGDQAPRREQRAASPLTRRRSRRRIGCDEIYLSSFTRAWRATHEGC